jgi:hypothetical protein
MEHKFEDLHAEVVKHLCEMFIDDSCLLRDKKSFINNPLLDHRIFDIFIHHIWGEPEYKESLEEFLKAEEAEQYAFDDRLRETVYDILYKARRNSRTSDSIQVRGSRKDVG